MAIGVFASLLLVESLQINQAPEDAAIDTIKSPVVVLTRDLYLGDVITETDVQIAQVPVEIVPRNAITSLEDAVGKIIKTDLVQGEMVFSHNLADPTNNIKDLSFVLSDDHILMAFPAEDLMSREGLVQRGDIVDIFATFEQEIQGSEEASPAAEEGEEPQEPETMTFTIDTMQKVSITAMVLEVIEEQTPSAPLQGESEDESNKPASKIKAYLLALDPQSALILKHLKDTNAIFDVVIRAPASTIQHELIPVTEDYIIEFYGLEILP